VLSDVVLQSWEATFDGFTDKLDSISRFPANGAANYPTVTQLDEARDTDILHVTCHGGLKEQDTDYFWSLDDQNPQSFDYRIFPDYARNARLSGRPLVFGNACASASPQSTDLKALLGFGPSFMIGGALNFVGTFAPITKTMAVNFAKRFYVNLLGTVDQPGRPIAEALRLTKASLENANDPSYLFYCLYGPADSTYKPVHL
jgi:CHAT domain-containing protein